LSELVSRGERANRVLDELLNFGAPLPRPQHSGYHAIHQTLNDRVGFIGIHIACLAPSHPTLTYFADNVLVRAEMVIFRTG
jgi:hypothetical protein